MGTNAFGQPMRRKEDVRLLTGQGRFTADLIGPDMARAAMLRSPHAHAAIVGIDTRAARAAPGVLAVLTGRDCRDAGLGDIPPGGDLIRLPGTPSDQGFVYGSYRVFCWYRPYWRQQGEPLWKQQPLMLGSV
jgi:carbon-monoxide dehydrogenase large subunit